MRAEDRMPITNALYGKDHPKYRKGTTQAPQVHRQYVHEQLDAHTKKRIVRRFPRMRFLLKT